MRNYWKRAILTWSSVLVFWLICKGCWWLWTCRTSSSPLCPLSPCQVNLYIAWVCTCLWRSHLNKALEQSARMSLHKCVSLKPTLLWVFLAWFVLVLPSVSELWAAPMKPWRKFKDSADFGTLRLHCMYVTMCTTYYFNLLFLKSYST